MKALQKELSRTISHLVHWHIQGLEQRIVTLTQNIIKSSYTTRKKSTSTTTKKEF